MIGRRRGGVVNLQKILSEKKRYFFIMIAMITYFSVQQEKIQIILLTLGPQSSKVASWKGVCCVFGIDPCGNIHTPGQQIICWLFLHPNIGALIYVLCF